MENARERTIMETSFGSNFQFKCSLVAVTQYVISDRNENEFVRERSTLRLISSAV